MKRFLLTVVIFAVFALPVFAAEVTPSVKCAVVYPGMTEVVVINDAGENGSLILSAPPKTVQGKLYLPVDGICNILDCPLNFNQDELVLPVNPEIRIPVRPDIFSKIQEGKELHPSEQPMLPARMLETYGFNVAWQKYVVTIERR